MRRLWIATALAALFVAAGGAVNVAQAASPVPPRIPVVGSGADLTSQNSLIELPVKTPDGSLPGVYAQMLFTVHAQPRSGYLGMTLEEKTSSGWFSAVRAPRVNFPLPSGTRGFSLNAGPYLCSGTNTYWRIAFVVNAVSSTGQLQVATYYFISGNGTTQVPGGVRINCG